MKNITFKDIALKINYGKTTGNYKCVYIPQKTTVWGIEPVHKQTLQSDGICGKQAQSKEV